MHTNNTLTAALGYAHAGWPVFLLGRSKRPLANCANCPSDAKPDTHDPQACRCLTCHSFYAATRDPKAIRRMFALVPYGMLAIRTGTASGLVVIDIDPRNGGTPSLAALRERITLPPTRYVRTGGNGWHLYYRYPGHTRISSGKHQLGQGIDVKADGGYVVAPPSLHPSTRVPYAWVDESTAIMDMAPALVDACVAHVRRPAPAQPASPTPPPRSGGAISHPDRLMATLLNRIHAAPEGRRRVTLYGCARGAALIVAAGHLTSSDAYNTLVAACDAAGWPWAKSTPNAIRDGFAAEGVTL
ncbi:bifunctional DNA primase/polymerase [Allorhizocola rhizosphaerae]|uniref:bifunctional DNA primase/polymerase n=1 Tax=Allorhizocola rhizosphaerae TaxID=1872709 RepID=UPI000E3E0BBB|nr:bifunctional DNA primase/polymerase [Allorhizocola rhizosphaerae]